MSAPQGFDVAEAIVSTLTAAAAFREPDESGAGVPVFDGPVATSSFPSSFVAVGWTAEDDPQAGTMEGEFVGFGIGGAREETGTIECVIGISSGSSRLASLRTSAKSVLEDVSDTLRATPSLGLAPVVQWAHITSIAWSQAVTPKGSYVRVNFVVSYLARI
jgi:hypothetical protein